MSEKIKKSLKNSFECGILVVKKKSQFDLIKHKKNYNYYNHTHFIIIFLLLANLSTNYFLQRKSEKEKDFSSIDFFNAIHAALFCVRENGAFLKEKNSTNNKNSFHIFFFCALRTSLQLT